MDMRDIEQLHAQYAQPPLTIDITAGVAATAPHLGYSGTSSAPAKASTPPFALNGNPRLLWGLGFVAVAALMFAIGTSIGKRESRAGSEQVQPLHSASDASARNAAGGGHEWPRKSDSVAVAEAAQSAAIPVTAEAAVAPASAASAVAVPEEQARDRSPAESKAEIVKRPAAPPAPAPAPSRAATVPAPAKTAQQLPTSAAPARNTAAQQANSPTDIKMF
ncbi:hypothetical protein [Cupriavidus sp. IK-TO18]|uniref:hypothetical protein n=1 Tax=Cupriavidus sp. IK-TO18 TaxID=2782182 RepID=UPI00189899B1|nr:hypothetical protein [Cupriavidus sp. IK-TO18]MBF6989329.1 hypothetical protein [Cupriavidus sp. IK-TO18]